jgi:hypothetical protein
MTEPAPALGPVQALRRIDAILADRSMSLPARVATVIVVLRADNNTGVGFPGYRYIQERYGIGSDSIKEALACPGGRAIGTHLVPAGKGSRGVQKFKVASPPATQDADASAQPTGALKDASAPEAGPQRTQNQPPAHPKSDASAPPVGAKLTTELAHELRERTDEPAPTDSLSPSVLQRSENGNGNGNSNSNGGTRENGNDVDRVIAFAFPGGPSEKQQAAVINAIGNATRQGASYPLLAHAVISPKAQGKTPWERIEEAGKRTAALLEKARSIWSDFKGETLLDLLKHMRQGWKPKPVVRREGESEIAFSERQQGASVVGDLAREIDAWREQATEWPKENR